MSRLSTADANLDARTLNAHTFNACSFNDRKKTEHVLQPTCHEPKDKKKKKHRCIGTNCGTCIPTFCRIFRPCLTLGDHRFLLPTWLSVKCTCTWRMRARDKLHVSVSCVSNDARCVMVVVVDGFKCSTAEQRVWRGCLFFFVLSFSFFAFSVWTQS